MSKSAQFTEVVGDDKNDVRRPFGDDNDDSKEEEEINDDCAGPSWTHASH